MGRRRKIALLVGFVLCQGLLSVAQPPGVWLDVPFVKQERDGCGAASMAMVMQYWEHQHGEIPGPDSDAVQIQRALYSKTARGIYASDMERYLRQHGFRTFMFAGERGDLQQHLAKGRPVIVALRPGMSEPLHYVVVAGLNEAQKLVLVNDPAQRKLLKQDQGEFEKEWKSAGHWTLLAIPQEGKPSAP